MMTDESHGERELNETIIRYNYHVFTFLFTKSTEFYTRHQDSYTVQTYTVIIHIIFGIVLLFHGHENVL